MIPTRGLPRPACIRLLRAILIFGNWVIHSFAPKKASRRNTQDRGLNPTILLRCWGEVPATLTDFQTEVERCCTHYAPGGMM